MVSFLQSIKTAIPRMTMLVFLSACGAPISTAQNVPGKPASLAKSTQTVTSTTAQTQVSGSTTQSTLPPPMPTEAPTVGYPATTRQEAALAAKRSGGRSDPLAPISASKSFPTTSDKSASKTGETISSTKSEAHLGPVSKLVPPPPPLPSEDELPVSALPLPPDKPSVASKLKLTAIVGDRGIFTINDFEARRINKWPNNLVMGPGDRFESIEMISVGNDSVVLREDGQRCVKALERIR